MDSTFDQHFAKLMGAGKRAYAVGNRSLAHRIWRRAAMLRPYDEQVWLALLKVVESSEDRRVCLENIVAINPSNLEIRDRLALLEMKQETSSEVPAHKPSARRRLFGKRILLLGVEAILLGILLAIALRVILY